MAVTAARLAEAMRLRATDQSELARELGVTQGAISKIVVGKTANSRLLPRIAAHLGVSLDWLLGESDEYDEASTRLYSRVERDWVALLRALDPQRREALLTVAEAMALAPPPPGQETLHDRQEAYFGKGEKRSGTHG